MRYAVADAKLSGVLALAMNRQKSTSPPTEVISVVDLGKR